MEIKDLEYITKYLNGGANENTGIGEHLFVLNNLMFEIVKNTQKEIMGVETNLNYKDKPITK